MQTLRYGFLILHLDDVQFFQHHFFSFYTFVQKQLSMYVSIYFWTLFCSTRPMDLCSQQKGLIHSGNERRGEWMRFPDVMFLVLKKSYWRNMEKQKDMAVTYAKGEISNRRWGNNVNRYKKGSRPRFPTVEMWTGLAPHGLWRSRPQEGQRGIVGVGEGGCLYTLRNYGCSQVIMDSPWWILSLGSLWQFIRICNRTFCSFFCSFPF